MGKNFVNVEWENLFHGGARKIFVNVEWEKLCQGGVGKFFVKEAVSRDVRTFFFHESNPSGPLINILK